MTGLVPYVRPAGKPWAIIVDIDGTVALRGERSPYDYARVGEDTINHPVVALVEAVSHTPYFLDAVLYVSGREAKCYDQTLSWLDQNVVLDPNCERRLLMRPSGDYRPDWQVKYDLFNQHIRGHYQILFVLDDRDQVVRMWRQFGLTCLQVAEGDF